VGGARQLIDRINAIQPLCDLPEWVWTTHQQFTNVITEVLAIAAAIAAEQRTCENYLTDNQLNTIWQNSDYAQPLRTALRQDFDFLIEADQLKAGFSVAEQTVTERLADAESSRWVAVFQNALRLTWIDHIEQQYPQLRSVSSLRMGQIEQALQESVGRKQALSRAILLVKLREQTYRNLAFNRLSNATTYRDLLHQTTKKRNVWPVRKLMESFDSEVFKVLPCWLASPESVSAMFPLRDDLFDLVIFDEASQCFAEHGIPAMARGKQVVVTGDNQQLRPSDLYRTRVDEPEHHEETPVAIEVESLLELAIQQLPQVSLTEHYRSRSLDLIAFSNQHFYQNKLLLLPPFSDANGHEPAIRYLHVNGVWQQNTNLTEAQAVLQLLSQIAIDLPGRSVGIVTFNYSQQQLIQELLDERVNEPSVPQLFVKNIENVQGDERDIIIFSVGYAADERGRLTMQFGSLSVNGGENRLNVAITRARERVYLITSLWPDQLLVSDTIHEGPKLLKAYLAYALNVSQGYFRPTPQPNALLPTTSLLKVQLAVQHTNWHFELPFADLTEKNGDTYQSLILTDDDAYYQQTSKQAHAYLPIALQIRKWPFQRIWSREFWRINGMRQTDAT
jgi:hypothetical protein